jgi:hypothetical protein
LIAAGRWLLYVVSNIAEIELVGTRGVEFLLFTVGE